MTLALTVVQPYASLIVLGHKRVENRRWHTTHRGRLMIHAGATVDHVAVARYAELLPRCLTVGALIGAVNVVDCTRGAVDPFALPHHWHWLLADAVALDEPIPMRGHPSLWDCGSF